MGDSLILNRTPAEITVVDAPEKILVAVEMLRDFDPEAVKFYDADKFWIGTKNIVTYQITGWDTTAKALVARRIA